MHFQENELMKRFFCSPALFRFRHLGTATGFKRTSYFFTSDFYNPRLSGKLKLLPRQLLQYLEKKLTTSFTLTNSAKTNFNTTTRYSPLLFFAVTLFEIKHLMLFLIVTELINCDSTAPSTDSKCHNM